MNELFRRLEDIGRVSLLPGGWFLLVVVISLAARTGEAQHVISTEITSRIQGVAYPDEQAPFLGLPGLGLDVGELPRQTALSAIAFDASGEALFVLETTTTLPDGLVAEPRDVIRFDGSTFSRVFDGSREGLPRNVRIDGISFSNRHLFSFDTTVSLGKGLVVADEDVVEWGGEGFERPLYFDGSEAGLDSALDIDAIDERGSRGLTVSFETAGTIDELDFDDDDLLTFDRMTARWTLTRDFSDLEPGFGPSDVNGFVDVPEPSGWTALSIGLLQMVTWRRRRSVE